MPQSLSLAQVCERGVIIEPEEALAVVQQLIDGGAAEFDPRPPLGPPSLGTVLVGSDGRLICRGCAITPAVSEIAILFDAMLSEASTHRMPGGLRYAIARALLEVDAPPFDSLADLSAVLARYERGDRRLLVRRLYERGAAAAPPPQAVVFVERRMNQPSVATLRRQLREADEALFNALAQIAETSPRRKYGRTWMVSAGAAVFAAFVGGYAGVRQTRVDDPPPAAPAVGIDDASVSLAEAPPNATTPVPPVRALDRSNGPVFSPSFASNGSAFFFHTGRTSDRESALASAGLSGDFHVMRIVDDGSRNFHVQPSPDGTQVAFDSDRDGERGVYVADSDGSHVRRISGRGYAAVPTWSPDGARLAFVRAEPAHPRVWNLWLQELATGASRRLTNFTYGQTWSASWFRDGRRVCYTHEDRLVILDLDTGTTRDIKTPIRGRLLRTPAVSPDGQHVVFQVSRNGAWLVNLTDGSMRCILTDPTAEEFAWSPDGRRVAFHSRRDGEWGIWILASS